MMDKSFYSFCKKCGYEIENYHLPLIDKICSTCSERNTIADMHENYIALLYQGASQSLQLKRERLLEHAHELRVGFDEKKFYDQNLKDYLNQ